jgi:hypothetical protein
VGSREVGVTTPDDYFPRPSGWDSSAREEPLGEFCRIHAFYSCPVCRGEEPVWVIPIENAQDEHTGNVFVHEGGSVTITGSPELPEPPQTVIVHLPAVSEREHSPVRDRDPRPGPSRSETVEVIPRLPRPTLSQRLAAAALFAEPLDPVWVAEAAARGRAVHDAAVALVEAEGIPYAEAIRRVLDERA